MNKLTMALVLLSTALFASTAQAENLLAGTTWQTYEDDKPKAVIKFTENSNGSVDGTIVSTTRNEGKVHVGKKVVSNLAQISTNKFGDGNITDPENNRTYNLSAVLNGKVLKLTGHYGPFSRSQTWKKK